jgi:hypothetical protein
MVVISDNARYHHAAALKDWLHECQGRNRMDAKRAV